MWNGITTFNQYMFTLGIDCYSKHMYAAYWKIWDGNTGMKYMDMGNSMVTFYFGGIGPSFNAK